MNTSDIEVHIEKWFKLKEDLNEIEKELEKHKNIVIKYMNENELDKIKSTKNNVSRTLCNRDFLNKKDIPSNIWEKYCKKNSYYVFKINKN